MFLRFKVGQMQVLSMEDHHFQLLLRGSRSLPSMWPVHQLNILYLVCLLPLVYLQVRPAETVRDCLLPLQLDVRYGQHCLAPGLSFPEELAVHVAGLVVVAKLPRKILRWKVLFITIHPVMCSSCVDRSCARSLWWCSDCLLFAFNGGFLFVYLLFFLGPKFRSFCVLPCLWLVSLIVRILRILLWAWEVEGLDKVKVGHPALPSFLAESFLILVGSMHKVGTTTVVELLQKRERHGLIEHRLVVAETGLKKWSFIFPAVGQVLSFVITDDLLLGFVPFEHAPHHPVEVLAWRLVVLQF